MSVFLRSLSGSAALAACAAALSLSAISCGSDDTSGVTGSGKDSTSTDEGDDDSDDSKPAVKHDAGKATVKHDAGTTSVGTNSGTSSGTTSNASGKADAGTAGGGDKSPTSANGALFCAAEKVIADKCNACHGATPAAGAPMSLLTYADLTAAAPVTKGKKVYEVVSTRTHATSKPMPPNGALAASDLAPIDAWIAAGAPAPDDPTCGGTGPVAAASDADWPPEGCDKSYKVLAGPVTVPAGQETHPQFVSDAPWGDEKVQAIMFRPVSDNLKVLHHWILNSQGGTSAFVSGWAPGQDNTLRKPLPADVGVYLPSGKQVLRMDMHYNNLQGTKAETDNSGVEICVTHALRKNAATTFMNFVGLPFIAPGQETDIVGTCNVVVTQPVFLMSESPHAHKLATHMKLEHIRAGKSTILHDAPFAFDAQISNALPAPFELKTGDQVITTCHYKNDTNNLVTFGEDTGNEMCFNFATYYPMGALSCSGSAPIDAGKAFGGS